MSSVSDNPITQLLAGVSRGDVGAQERLYEIIYPELLAEAHRQLRNERRGPDLQTTILVHDAYFRLAGDDATAWENRRHFFGAAGNAMRQVRADYARKRGSQKRGSGRAPAELTDAIGGPDDDPLATAAFHEAWEKLTAMDPRGAEVVNLRCFAGLSVAETAELLSVSDRTVEADLRAARAWLHEQLSANDADNAEH
jgi:RNA polymerase sigma factor (TIGR02999 family)